MTRQAWMQHSWMRLVESSNTEVSGASEVPQSRGTFLSPLNFSWDYLTTTGWLIARLCQ